jgi:hypothetical protein
MQLILPLALFGIVHRSGFEQSACYMHLHLCCASVLQQHEFLLLQMLEAVSLSCGGSSTGCHECLSNIAGVVLAKSDGHCGACMVAAVCLMRCVVFQQRLCAHCKNSWWVRCDHLSCCNNKNGGRKLISSYVKVAMHVSDKLGMLLL